MSAMVATTDDRVEFERVLKCWAEQLRNGELPVVVLRPQELQLHLALPADEQRLSDFSRAVSNSGKWTIEIQLVTPP